MPAVQLEHEIDPREAILAKVGDISGVELFGTDVLVAIYERPNRTKSGLYLSDKTLEEDVHQGKLGLIVKMGPKAFVDDDSVQFSEAERCEVGQFVFFRPSDGWRVTLNTLRNVAARDNLVNCRIVRDTSIRGRVAHPDLVY